MAEHKELRTPSNQSSEKLLIILELLAQQQKPLRLKEISELCDMNSSTVLRFLYALQKRNYVAQDPDSGMYYVTFKLCALAHSVSTYNSIRSIALPFMRGVASTFNESCNLAIDSDMSMMYIEVMNCPSSTLLSTQRIGNVAPMHCTGVGKLFLSDYSPAELEKFLALKKLPVLTEFTISTQKELAAELETIRQLDYAFDNQECEMGVRCIAVPIRDYTGKIHAGLSVSGPAVRMTDQFIYAHLDYLRETAVQLSMCMGWRFPEQ